MMKKEYVKPSLFAESFSMLEHIANCTIGDGYEATLRSGSGENPCSYTDNGITLYLSEVTCAGSYNARQYGSWEDYVKFLEAGLATCYNAFATGNAFNS